MLRHHLKSAFRNLWKNKVFSVINIAGLSIGISSTLLIYMVVSYDFRFDKFQKDNNRIYRVVTDMTVLGETDHSSGVTYPMPAAIKNELSGIENVVHFFTVDNDEQTKVSIPRDGHDEDVVFSHQEDVVFADGEYFNLIPYTWLAGSPQTALAKTNQAVLTESISAKYFPDLKPSEIVGRKIIFNDSLSANVTGIVQDIEQATDFKFKIFISKPTLETYLISKEDKTEWGGANSASQLFIKLSKGTSSQQITAGINALYKKYRKPGRLSFAVTLQPLNDVHFNITYPAGFIKRMAHKPTLYGLLIVAAFILILGCINFINLTTAQASQRAKEIGIRKTMGGSKNQLAVQFLGEAFLLTLCAACISVAIGPWLLKIFAGFIPAEVDFKITADIIGFMFAIVVAVTLLSGFYPAVILSSFRPIPAIRNQAFDDSTRGLWLRKTLTISQFVIAQIFVIGTIVVSKQVAFTLRKDLGFKKDAIIYLRTNPSEGKPSDRFVFMDKLKNIPEVKMQSLASDPPSINGAWMNTFQYKDGRTQIETAVQVKRADTNYLSLFGIKLVAGRNLSTSDTTKELVINETYVRSLGLGNAREAIGKLLYWDNHPYPVVGVVRDFHQRSLHEVITPLVLTTGTEQMGQINIALASNNTREWAAAITKIEKAWKEVYPSSVFEYRFLDDTVKKYYTAEQKTARLLWWSAALAIFISCLGLLGLISYIAHQRTKEIGIRKVLGASVSSIIALFSKDFVRLVLIALIIATPIAWWLSYRWLLDFAYRIDIEWWMFVASGIVTLFIVILTVGIQALKAAMANPVKSLRTE